MATLGGPLRPGVVHRLDKNTRGVILVAKTDASYRHLTREFKERLVHKEYRALVYGRMGEPSGTVDAPIDRHARNRTKMGVVKDGREALSSCWVERAFREVSLLKVIIRDPAPRLSGFANPMMAEAIDQAIDQDLQVPGAIDVTAPYRPGPRKVVRDGGTYLRPTIVRCDSFAHPLANREFFFPYASVVQVPQEKMIEVIGPSLVVTAINRDPAFRARLLGSPLIQRLNLGPISTMKVSWDQPHEGNMFEFLYKRRSIEVA